MDERGQASVEWIGVVALIAVVMAVVLALALPGAGIAGAFVRQFHRALCIVSGGVCDLDRRPCPIASSATKDDGHVNLGLIRLGRDELILYEKQSDGSVLVSYVHETNAGVEVGVGADGTITVKGMSLSASRSARAAVLAGIGGGETWRFPDAYAADAGMAALSEGHEPGRGERVDVIDDRKSIRAQLTASGAIAGRASGGVSLDASLVEGVAHDPRDGSRTYVLSGSLAAAAVLKVSKAGAAGAASGEERIAVTTAADGSPRELSIVRTGKLEGAYSLPDIVQGVAEQVTGGHHGGRTWVVESRLDLTDPENWRAASAFVGALPLVKEADADALRRRIDVAGVIETRTYALATKDNGRWQGHVGRGAVFGFGIGEVVESMSLLGAEVRGPDGQWRTRDDCLAAA
jgi:hypothetical protein